MKKGRTMSDLRAILFEQIDGLCSGDKTVEETKAVCNAAKEIINSAKTELDYHRMVADMDQRGVEYQPYMGVMALTKDSQ